MHKYSTDAAAPPETLAELARQVRCRALRMVHRAKLGHTGGDLSAADILVALYFGVLRVDASSPLAPVKRDVEIDIAWLLEWPLWPVTEAR